MTPFESTIDPEDHSPKPKTLYPPQWYSYLLGGLHCDAHCFHSQPFACPTLPGTRYLDHPSLHVVWSLINFWDHTRRPKGLEKEENERGTAYSSLLPSTAP